MGKGPLKSVNIMSEFPRIYKPDPSLEDEKSHTGPKQELRMYTGPDHDDEEAEASSDIIEREPAPSWWPNFKEKLARLISNSGDGA